MLFWSRFRRSGPEAEKLPAHAFGRTACTTRETRHHRRGTSSVL